MSTIRNVIQLNYLFSSDRIQIWTQMSLLDHRFWPFCSYICTFKVPKWVLRTNELTNERTNTHTHMILFGLPTQYALRAIIIVGKNYRKSRNDMFWCCPGWRPAFRDCTRLGFWTCQFFLSFFRWFFLSFVLSSFWFSQRQNGTRFRVPRMFPQLFLFVCGFWI